MTDAAISAPPSVVELANLTILPHFSKELFSGSLSAGELMQSIQKAATDAASASKQGVRTGRQEHPFDFAQVSNFQLANVHHSTCIQAKVNSIVGLGFQTPAIKAKIVAGEKVIFGYDQSKADRALDPLCEGSFAETLADVCEDWAQTGNGYIEVVRTGKAITGLHHLPANDAYIYVENAQRNHHYEIIGSEDGHPRRFAAFGDKEDFLKRGGKGEAGFAVEGDPDTVSEVVAFRRPTSLSRWYGFPEWLAAVACIELVQCATQQRYDFFLNRGVPEFMLFIMGQKLTTPEWEKIELALKSNIGNGNSHKSLALNLANPEIKIQLEKLAIEGKGDDGVEKLLESASLTIVSAHRVPPLLAGIQIPGKLGAVNELPNALMAFQVLVCGPAQRLFQQKLGSTLGNAAASNLKLAVEDFTFNRITDQINLGSMDTVSRMRDNAATGRDASEGLKD